MKSRYDRQKICTIISRTDNITQRQYDDLSSEWVFHNVMYAFKIREDSAEDTFLDYNRDPRFLVRAVTDILELFGWE